MEPPHVCHLITHFVNEALANFPDPVFKKRLDQEWLKFKEDPHWQGYFDSFSDSESYCMMHRPFWNHYFYHSSDEDEFNENADIAFGSQDESDEEDDFPNDPDGI